MTSRTIEKRKALLRHVDVAVSFQKQLPLHQDDVAVLFFKINLQLKDEVAHSFVKKRMTQPISLSFGKLIFEPALIKAEK